MEALCCVRGYRRGVRPLPRLRRFVLPSTVLTAVVAGSLAAAPPASADVTGTTSSGDVVLYNHCQQHPINYQLAEVGLLPLRVAGGAPGRSAPAA